MATSPPHFLTKSLFTSALECPTALYYATHAEYPSQKDEDDFLLSLAKGGMQVGAHQQPMPVSEVNNMQIGVDDGSMISSYK